jgi:hypothetical protein
MIIFQVYKHELESELAYKPNVRYSVLMFTQFFVANDNTPSDDNDHRYCRGEQNQQALSCRDVVGKVKNYPEQKEQKDSRVHLGLSVVHVFVVVLLHLLVFERQGQQVHSDPLLFMDDLALKPPSETHNK